MLLTRFCSTHYPKSCNAPQTFTNNIAWSTLLSGSSMIVLLRVNQRSKGDKGMRKGSHHREESKAALRVFANGRNHDPKTIQKIREVALGRKHTPETRRKMSQTRRRGMKTIYVPHLWFAVDPMTKKLRLKRLRDQPIRIYEARRIENSGNP